MDNTKPKDYWTKEKCIESALKYERPVQWIKHKSSAYNAAKINN